MRRAAQPMLCVPVVQAVTIEMFGPCKLYFIEICPATMLIIPAGIKNGDTRLGPPATKFILVVGNCLDTTNPRANRNAYSC